MITLCVGVALLHSGPLLLLLFYYMALQRSSWARSTLAHISFYLFTNGRIRVSSALARSPGRFMWLPLCGERKVNGCPPVSLGHIHFSKRFDCINQINLLELKVLGKINLKVGALKERRRRRERGYKMCFIRSRKECWH